MVAGVILTMLGGQKTLTLSSLFLSVLPRVAPSALPPLSFSLPFSAARLLFVLVESFRLVSLLLPLFAWFSCVSDLVLALLVLSSLSGACAACVACVSGVYSATPSLPIFDVGRVCFVVLPPLRNHVFLVLHDLLKRMGVGVRPSSLLCFVAGRSLLLCFVSPFVMILDDDGSGDGMTIDHLSSRAGPGGGASTSEVALKMIRNNDTMRKAAQKEVALLKELAEHDPLNKKHCIR